MLFIDTAYAMAASPESGASPYQPLIILVIIFAIFYFLLIRPQQRKQKEHRRMIDALKKGDEIVTAGGIHGTVTKIKDDIAYIEISEQVKIRVSRASIAMIKKKSE
jgi:preprotein translocase subunit YajC